MKRVLVVLLAGACACTPQKLSVVQPSPTATIRVRSGANEITPSLVIPANVPHAIAWCDSTRTWNTHRWYLIRIDAVDQDWTGELTQDVQDPQCVHTTSVYAFTPGGHNLEVILWNHCEAGDPDPVCQSSPPDGVPCDLSVGCDVPGLPATLTVVAAGGQALSGAPPSILNGQVAR